VLGTGAGSRALSRERQKTALHAAPSGNSQDGKHLASGTPRSA
jgi:hypothetical protein